MLKHRVLTVVRKITVNRINEARTKKRRGQEEDIRMSKTMTQAPRTDTNDLQRGGEGLETIEEGKVKIETREHTRPGPKHTQVLAWRCLVECVICQHKKPPPTQMVQGLEDPTPAFSLPTSAVGTLKRGICHPSMPHALQSPAKSPGSAVLWKTPIPGPYHLGLPMP